VAASPAGSASEVFAVSKKFSKKNLDSEINESLKSILKDANGVIESCRAIVGDDEMSLQAELWQKYYRDSPDALRYAIHKWWAMDVIKRNSIKHPPAWLTAVFQRAERTFAKNIQN
jgi:hypothetical protein